MIRTRCSGRRHISSGVLVFLAVMASGLLMVATSGCSSASGQQTTPPSATTKQAAPAKPAKPTKTPASTAKNPNVAGCYECSGKGKPPISTGKATIESGIQIVNIKLENGNYVPNRIPVKAGIPVKVVFTGKAKDCVGMPKFGALNKQVDIRKTGSGTIELGSLSAGTYVFTCGMGANAGSIVVR